MANILSTLTNEQILYLRTVKLCVATPHHTAQVSFCYLQGLLELQEWFLLNAQAPTIIQEVGDSLVTRARMCLLDAFLRTDCTHIMMIDGDISFKIDDVINLLLEKVDIVGAVYPKKNYFFDRVDEFLRGDKKLPEGFDLKSRDIATEYVFTPMQNGDDRENILESLDVGTGFMLVSMTALRQMLSVADYWISDIHNSKTFKQPVANLFDTEIEPGTKRYLSEDYAFCRRAQRLGIKTYIHKKINIGHHGTAIYKADFSKRFKKEQNDK